MKEQAIESGEQGEAAPTSTWGAINPRDFNLVCIGGGVAHRPAGRRRQRA